MLYTFYMGAVQFFLAIFGALKNHKALAGGSSAAIILIFAVGFIITEQVNAKHKEAMSHVSRNRDQITELLVQNQKMLVTLHSIKDSIEDVKESANETNKRVWEIARDLRGKK